MKKSETEMDIEKAKKSIIVIIIIIIIIIITSLHFLSWSLLALIYFSCSYYRV